MFTLIIAPLLENVTPPGAFNRSNTVIEKARLFVTFLWVPKLNSFLAWSFHILVRTINSSSTASDKHDIKFPDIPKVGILTMSQRLMFKNV